MALHTLDPVDGGLFKLIMGRANQPKNRPIIDAVEAFTAQPNVAYDAEAVRQVALAASRDELKLEGQPRASADRVAMRAYESTTVAAVEKPFLLKQDPRATAKSVHYFASGAIAAKVSAFLGFLPAGPRHWLGFHVSHLVGVLKEVADKIKGTGFNRHDIATDDAGSRSALQ